MNKGSLILAPERASENQDDGEVLQTTHQHGGTHDPLREVGQCDPGEGGAGDAQTRSTVTQG